MVFLLNYIINGCEYRPGRTDYDDLRLPAHYTAMQAAGGEQIGRFEVSENTVYYRHELLCAADEVAAVWVPVVDITEMREVADRDPRLCVAEICTVVPRSRPAECLQALDAVIAAYERGDHSEHAVYLPHGDRDMIRWCAARFIAYLPTWLACGEDGVWFIDPARTGWN